MKPTKKGRDRSKARRRAMAIDGLMTIDEVIADQVETVLRPVEAASFAQVAVLLAGNGATDVQIQAQFGRAWLIVESARKWLDEDDAAGDVGLENYLKEQAAAVDICLPWSDPCLHAAVGYTGRGRDEADTGRLLKDALDARIGRKLSSASLAAFRKRYRKSIPLTLLTQLWASTARPARGHKLGQMAAN